MGVRILSNSFVDYLNSMNNATSGNINALAEAQVTNKYYNYIRVDRKLGKFIVNKIKQGDHRTYILTGHAGDGKTSILVQVLRDLNLLHQGEKLKVSDTLTNNEISIMYVKDMSELSEGKQIELLKESLEAPKNNISSILISNTGPLIKSFNTLFAENEHDCDEIEDILIKQLDTNTNEPVNIHGYDFNLINIARVENLGFVKEVINKICTEDLWTKCCGCKNEEKCPMYFNKKYVSSNKSRVIDFVETYYRFLQENDKRVTIRQMIAQISYAFTGNIKCQNINSFDNRMYNKFNFNFANLFFGYRGIQQVQSAKQIKGIDLIQNLLLDSVSLKEDYSMFVKGDFSNFPLEIREIIEDVWKTFAKEVYHIEDEDKSIVDKQNEMRKAIRRFFLIYGLTENNDELQELFDQIYGKMFTLYKKCTTAAQSPRKLREIRRTIYEALYIKNIGVPPTSSDSLYLTLTRHDGDFQNVFLMLGKAKESELEVIQISRNIDIEDIAEGFTLQLNINGENQKIKLTLPLLMYFASVVNGEISTEINPSLSHGLAELNALLLREFRVESKNQMQIIVNTVSGAKEIKIEFEDGKMFVN